MFECYEDFESFVSQRLAKLREQKEISARDMSLSIGMGEGYINHIENKGSMPSMEGLFYICEFLKIEPKDFFDAGTQAPDLLKELMDECKKLDRDSIQALLTFLRNNKK